MPQKTGLDLLRVPFPEHHISKLPKPTKAQTDAVKADYRAGERCAICGGWHHPKVVHLDYVGHAALTDRLLDADPQWSWEPLSFDDDGLPVLDKDGGMWIKLTVCGVTRLGYGDAQGKQGGDAMKERIGDALRNAAMRFGAALDLWHKGDLHMDDAVETTTTHPIQSPIFKKISPEQIANIETLAEEVGADMKAFLKYLMVTDLSDLVADRYDSAITALEKKRKKEKDDDNI